MKKIKTLLFSLFLLGAGCEKKCDYAVYEFKNSNSGKTEFKFQIILHAIWENRIELIGKNFSTDEYWKFRKGDYILINDNFKLNFWTDDQSTIPDISKNESEMDSLYLTNKYLNDFTSNKLTKTELDFILNNWITNIKIINGDKKWNVDLTSEASENFRNVFNCNFQKDQNRKNEILESN